MRHSIRLYPRVAGTTKSDDLESIGHSTDDFWLAVLQYYHDKSCVCESVYSGHLVSLSSYRQWHGVQSRR